MSSVSLHHPRGQRAGEKKEESHGHDHGHGHGTISGGGPFVSLAVTHHFFIPIPKGGESTHGARAGEKKEEHWAIHKAGLVD